MKNTITKVTTLVTATITDVHGRVNPKTSPPTSHAIATIAEPAAIQAEAA